MSFSKKLILAIWVFACAGFLTPSSTQAGGGIRFALRCAAALWQKKSLPEYQLLREHEVFDHFGKPDLQALKQDGFVLVTANLAKAEVYGEKSRKQLPRNLMDLTADADIVALQETRLNPQGNNTELFPHQNQLHWFIASSSKNEKGHKTGAATGGRAQTLNPTVHASTTKEIATLTSKMGVVTEYKIEGKETTLLVFNIHMINFVTNGIYKFELSNIESILKAHQGPILLTGDFNTWAPGRTKPLLDMVKRLNLKHADDGSQRFPYLYQGRLNWTAADWTFSRDLKLKRAELIRDVHSSDHQPHRFEFSFEDWVRYGRGRAGLGALFGLPEGGNSVFLEGSSKMTPPPLC